jgi:hypothetical protein
MDVMPRDLNAHDVATFITETLGLNDEPAVFRRPTPDVLCGVVY